MVAEESKLFGCPHCGFRVGPQDEVCSRCGNKFLTGTMFECPFCGELVPRGAKACPTCFVDFGEFQQKAVAHASDESIDNLLMDIIRLEASEVKTQDKRLSCPRCSWLLDGTEDTCPKCGMAFTAEATYQCPICGAFVSSEAESCSECWTAFGEEEETHKEVETAASDLLTAMGQRDRIPQPVTEAPPEQPTPEPPTEHVAPEPAQIPEPGPEPVQEPVPELVEPPAGAAEPAPAQEAEKAAEPAPAAPKKPRTRKLKVKPAGPKA